ncbi:MAG: phosphatidylserine/phosphatidylglycerophosphate/cardiolipin synthase family protein [Myxococcales bacterium]|nr:phosphatidylserine/phosphatidylglycerophosphate/cardiolipin synthase family protein [Myxococcales bacterium]
MNVWKRTVERTVDQRDLVLPPTWSRRAAKSAAPVEALGILRSDPTRVVAQEVCRAITEARQMVVVSSFLLADKFVEGALQSCARRGVRVYMLLASETRLEKDPREDESRDVAMVEQHRAMLKDLAGWAFLRSSEAFHAKTVLVDPGGTNPRGWLLTSNLTREALERNEELAVRLNAAETRAAFAQLRWAFWERAQHELRDPGLFQSVNPMGRVSAPAGSDGILATAGTASVLRERFLSEVRAAKRQIVVASFGWSETHPAVQTLCERAAHGVQVIVLARPRPVAMPALLALAKSGARVFGFPWLHAKALLVDEQRGLVMSANLEPHGLDEGFELGVVLDDRRVEGLAQMLTGWANSAPFELAMAPRVGDLSGACLVWRESALQPYEVLPEREQALSPMVAQSADAIERAELPLPAQRDLPTPAHVLRLTCSVSAPQLGAKAEPVKVPNTEMVSGGASLYRERSGRVVVAVTTPEQLSDARRLADESGAAAIVVREELR